MDVGPPVADDTKRPTHALRFQVLTTTVGALALLVLLFGAGVLNREYQRGMSNLEARAGLLAALQLQPLARQVYDFNTPVVQQMVDAFQGDPDFLRAAVADGTGAAVAVAERPGGESEPAVVVERPLRHDTGSEVLEVGILTLALSTVRVREELMRNLVTDGLALVGLVVVMALVVVGNLNRILRPMAEMTAVMRRLADGALGDEVPHRRRADEVGEVARAVQVFKENSLARQQLAADREEQDRLRLVRMQQLEVRIAAFTETMGAVTGTLADVVRQVHAASDSLKAVAGDVNNLSSNASAAVGQTSASVRVVATRTTELVGTADVLVSRMDGTSREIRNVATVVAEAGGIMASLSVDAERIGAVIQLIERIAGQTNLLALNATIEAARAGTAGKGFAVVAGEVKTLARQTAEATEQITNQIGGVQETSQRALQAMQAVTGAIGRIDGAIQSIREIVDEQRTATSAMNRSLQEAVEGNHHAEDNIVEVARHAGNSDGLAGQMVVIAAELTRQTEVLRSQLEQFVTELRDRSQTG